MRERLYNDYIMKNRYKEYKDLLSKFIEADYKNICIKDYDKLKNDDEKYLIIRHDIDSDVKIAKRLFEIEKELNIKSTYYFRLSTMDKKLIYEIVKYGSEVGYHYEELAQFCKEHNKSDIEFVKNNMFQIQEKFLKNIKYFEEKNAIKLNSIASHGDFMNRKIGLPNKIIYDEKMQEKLKLIESYSIENMIDYRTADDMYPKFWKEDPMVAIRENKRRVLILIHPRWWNRAPLTRLKLDIKRVLEGVKYR